MATMLRIGRLQAENMIATCLRFIHSLRIGRLLAFEAMPLAFEAMSLASVPVPLKTAICFEAVPLAFDALHVSVGYHRRIYGRLRIIGRPQAEHL